MRPPAISLDPEAAPGGIVRGHALDPAGKLVSDDQQSLERRCRQEGSDPLDRHVVLPQPRRLGLRPGRRYWQRGTPISHDALSEITTPHIASPAQWLSA